jgi:NAD+ diphosphatase
MSDSSVVDSSDLELSYSGGGLDRVGYQRLDPAWVAHLLAEAELGVIPLWRERCMVSGDPPTPVKLDAEAARVLVSGDPDAVLLGLDGTRRSSRSISPG